MELKDFVKGVIFDITSAISECQKELNNGTIVSPTNVSSGSNEKINTREGKLSVSCIDFEVSVAAGMKTNQAVITGIELTY